MKERISTAGRWQPILEGVLADRARAAARSIAMALTDHVTPAEDLALYWAYTASVFPDLESSFDAAADRLATRIVEGYSHPALYGGVAGAGFVTAHVADNVEPLLGAIDNALLDRLTVTPWHNDYDLIRGLVGFGVYFLERGVVGRAGLDRVLDQLVSTAIDRGDGQLAWHTAPDLLPAHQRTATPAGHWNCGLAHGVPGVVALAARVSDHSIAARLRDGGTRWLHAQRSAKGWPSIVEDRELHKARAAWCYGDPGVLVALYSAAPSAALVELAVASLSRSLTDSGVADAGLCHGAIGLAHIANRLFHATRDARFCSLARTWYACALDFQIPSEGIGGFRAWHGLDKAWYTTASFLEGAVGIGLALQAATTDVEPRWDRLLLCDLLVD